MANVTRKVYVAALWASLDQISVLLLAKLLAKMAGVWPLTSQFEFGIRKSSYTTLLMSSDLTFVNH